MEKIYCPYCEATEEAPDGVEMQVDEPQLYKAKTYDVFLARCFCSKCQCSSPIMVANNREEARAKAIAAATRRCVPMLRPLTWDKAIEDDYFLEIKGDEYIDVALLQAAFATEGRILPCDHALFTTHSIDGLKLMGVDYGKTWRCWSRRPTEDERKAAKWRDDCMENKQAEERQVKIEQPEQVAKSPSAEEKDAERRDDYKNEISLYGWLQGELLVTHEIEGKPFYEGVLLVKRLSGCVDKLHLLVPGSVHDAAKLDYKKQVRVIGEIRTYNEVVDPESGKARLRIKVFAKKMLQDDSPEGENAVDVIGVLCKPPVFRITPSGKRICDLMVAVKYSNGKTGYLPSVTWGKVAERVAGYHVGEKVHLEGRLQSRDYQKWNEHAQLETRTVHELSAYAVYMAENLWGGEKGWPKKHCARIAEG